MSYAAIKLLGLAIGAVAAAAVWRAARVEGAARWLAAAAVLAGGAALVSAVARALLPMDALGEAARAAMVPVIGYDVAATLAGLVGAAALARGRARAAAACGAAALVLGWWFFRALAQWAVAMWGFLVFDARWLAEVGAHALAGGSLVVGAALAARR